MPMDILRGYLTSGQQAAHSHTLLAVLKVGEQPGGC